MTSGTSSGLAGVIAIIGACVAVSCLITWVTGSYTHWIFVIAGIVVGLWAVQAINR